jgi:hypothetical protein
MAIRPEGDRIRNAVKWIGQEKKADPKKSTQELIEAAGLKFNLSPAEMEFLGRRIAESPET